MDYRIYILLILSIQALAGSAYIFLRKSNKSFSTSILSLFLLTIGLIFCETLALNILGTQNTNPVLVLASYMFFVLCLTLPPTFYLYVSSLINKKELIFDFKRVQILYGPAFFLFIINAFSFIALYIIPPDTLNYNLCKNVLTYSNFISLFFIFLLQNVYYIFHAWQLYFKQKAVLSDLQNKTASLALNWVKWFILLYTALIIMLYLFQMQPFLTGKLGFRLFMVVYLGLLIFYGRNKYQFELKEDKNKYLDEQKRQELKKALLNLMQIEKPFLHLDLSVKSLAGMLNTNSNYLSFLINKEFGCNFSSFVNKYRVKEAKVLLQDPAYHKYKIESIAEMTGFKSKSAFNYAFKKETNLTPSKFKIESEKKTA